MKNLTDIAADVKSGKVSARSLVESALAKAEEKKEFNAIISTVRDRALERADQIDQKIKNGEEAGRLAGVPFIAKDNFLSFGAPTTAASNMLKDFDAPYQATAIERLEAEGAILVAKANLDAFAHGGSTENSDFGPTKNPYDPSRVPGGSSGGSSAGLALGIAPFALGTDTGGSIRQPASFCGVVGLKPTYGLTSRFGVVAMASSTDVIGPMAHSVYDAALVLDITAGKDGRDSALVERSRSYLPESVDPMRIGVVKEYISNGVDPEVRERILEVAEKLRSLGHTVEEVSLPSLPLSLAVYYVVVPAEISSNLARYDGVKYGHSSPNAKTLHDLYGMSRDEGLNDENMRRILIGTYVLSSGYYDAYYKKAQTVRTKLINEFSQTFQNYDVLLGPVAPTPAFKLGEISDDPLSMYLADVMTAAANLAGLPAVSLPAGQVRGLPVGAQLIAPMLKDQTMLSLAAQLEEVL